MTTALDLNEMKRIVSYINIESHKMHAERLIQEVERLRRFDLTNEEFRNFSSKYGVFDAPTGMQFVAIKIPEGYELACREMRAPKRGEYFMDHSDKNNIAECRVDYFEHEVRVIVRKKWEWPEWLLANWIAMDANRNWFAYTGKQKPVINAIETSFMCDEDSSCYKSKLFLDQRMIKLEFPKIDNWKNSLIKNPNYKEKE